MEPVVARAYLDQLTRDGGLDEALSGELDTALTAVESGQNDSARLRQLADAVAQVGGDGMTARRTAALAETLRGLGQKDSQ